MAEDLSPLDETENEMGSTGAENSGTVEGLSTVGRCWVASGLA